MDLARAIRDAVGVPVSDRPPDQLSYARDLWPRHHIGVRDGRLPATRPRAVAWPANSDEVAALVRFCKNEGVRLVPFGAGSGVCGGIAPTREMLVVDLKRLNRWRRFAPDEGYLEVEAGALGIRLEEELNAKGYTVGHFPSSILCSTVGGWIAARGAGQCSGLYGKIEDMTASVECVDGRGEIATLRRRRGGPDITPLLVGSEGVLGVITAARLRLHRQPTLRALGSFSFATMEIGWETIRAIYQAGLRPAVCRLYDPFDSMLARRSAHRGTKKRRAAPRSSAAVSALLARGALRIPSALNSAIDALGTRVLGGALLVLVFEGDAARAEDELASARKLASAAGGEDLGDGPARHWLEHRYSVSYRQAPTFMMGAFADTMEVAAPWSRLGALYEGVRRALGEHVMVMAHMSHAYPDGCSIYFTFAASAKDGAAAERVYDDAWDAALGAALEAGGTLSHHHGVGRSKAPRMGDELGLGVEIVAALRGAFDPDGLLNPGNLMPPTMPPRRAPTPPPERPVLDVASQTIHAAGEHTLGAVEAAARAAGLSLRADHDAETPLAAWLARGAPGAPDPWLDPVDHLVAGYEAILPSGAALAIRPCPRRAVGPDLWALFSGTDGRAGRIHSVHLRVRGPVPPPLDTPLERDPAMDATEQTFVDRAIAAAAGLR